ncbi:hypothetical protein D4764_03G0002760 [Takifugu flavidus]|uniref:Uncharacterized protein n=1 Tax=Takifugu flavidus TaxID=433684 RepID=A0A5C6N8Z9_9TELE|nr:hypothetical protein D4764_03G0002760 [Takifugu flavidus]
MSFFTDKVLAIREKANQAIPTTGPSPDVPTVGTYRVSNEPLSSFSPIYFSEVSSLIQKSKTTTCLLDPIPTHLLKDVLPLIGSSILDQINGSLVSGYVPRSYKVAVIKPLLKKPSLDPDVLANYRPISNLPFISKVLEKVVVTQLLAHLQRNGLFEMFHFRSWTGLYAGLLDLSAAFDTVDHSILLQRLEHVIGIKGTALDWFRSYLSDRYQFAYVHGVPSSYRNIIRQHGINLHCYADDTQLYLSMKPEETEKHRKTEVMVFGPEPLWDRLDHMITLDGISLTSSLSELVIPYQPNRPLRSQNAGLLVVPRVSRSRMGGRAFSYQAPLLWNQLPVQAKAAGVRKHDHLNGLCHSTGNSGPSQLGLMYSHTGRNKQCERKTNTCFYSFSMKNVNTSQTGTYYCAVAACGHILFGNGTKLVFEGVAWLQLSGLFDQLNLSRMSMLSGSAKKVVLPPAILPSRVLCRKGVRASWHWAVGCRLVSVGRDAPAGTPHGVDHLVYWTHCCFGSVPLSGLSPVLRATAGTQPLLEGVFLTPPLRLTGVQSRVYPASAHCAGIGSSPPRPSVEEQAVENERERESLSCSRVWGPMHYVIGHGRDTQG